MHGFLPPHSTCLISVLSFLMPVRSVLVAPVCPSSWMEMAGLVADDWIGRTFTQYREIIEERQAERMHFICSLKHQNYNSQSYFFVLFISCLLYKYCQAYKKIQFIFIFINIGGALVCSPMKTGDLSVKSGTAAKLNLIKNIFF